MRTTKFDSASIKTVNVQDADLFRCRFCGAMCHPESTNSGCLNAPISKKLNVPCNEVLANLADINCLICKGSGLTIWREDAIPGVKLNNPKSKVCECITGPRPRSGSSTS